MNDSVPIDRWPAPASARLVALMGGSFDPVHLGHVELGLAARDAMQAPWLVFMPAARNPLKPIGPMLDDRLRIELLALALNSTPGTAISTLELESPEGEPSYTIDTLRQLLVLAPETRVRLVIGADSARSFHRWRDPQGIIAIAEPVVVLRSPDDTADRLIETMSPFWPRADLDRWRNRIIRTPLVDASSTEIRGLLEARAWDDPRLRAALAPAVLDRLRARG